MIILLILNFRNYLHENGTPSNGALVSEYFSGISFKASIASTSFACFKQKLNKLYILFMNLKIY